MSILKLSLGSKRAIQLLNDLDRRKFKQLSNRVLDAMPIEDAHSLFTDEERKKLVTAFALHNLTDLNQLISVCIELWREIAYHQLKLERLKTNLEQLGFVSDLTDVIVQVWSERGTAVSDRLRGHSQLLDVNWTLRMDIAKRDCPKVRKPKVILELVTDQGPKLVEMSRAELIELFNNLQHVQKRIDSLLQ
ncbi:COMM domain-containing protein 10 [Toxocara canis]|uniref:COMM domain-containing protein 10 n=1 Tax=Toxocara canis TaxID=6265 RepID=A0A0B2UY21_TOXCA|nr:COMM domain-containing protein 10 [Toxocara canis]